MSESSLSSESMKIVGHCGDAIDIEIMEMAFRIADVERKELLLTIQQLQKELKELKGE